MHNKEKIALVAMGAFIAGYTFCGRVTAAKIKSTFLHMTNSVDVIVDEAVELLKLQTDALGYALENSMFMPSDVREELIKRIKFIEFAASHITTE